MKDFKNLKKKEILWKLRNFRKINKHLPGTFKKIEEKYLKKQYRKKVLENICKHLFENSKHSTTLEKLRKVLKISEKNVNLLFTFLKQVMTCFIRLVW